MRELVATSSWASVFLEAGLTLTDRPCYSSQGNNQSYRIRSVGKSLNTKPPKTINDCTSFVSYSFSLIL